MARSLSKYSFINAKLRARISNILSEEVFRQMESAPSIDAAMVLLRPTCFAGLESMYSKTGDIKLAELELLKEEISLYQNVRGFTHSSSTEIVDALLVRFEIENLKNAIRIFFDRTIRKRTADISSQYILHEKIIHNVSIDAILNANHFDEIVDVCHGTPYEDIVKKHARSVETDGRLFRMEVGFDHYYYRNLLEVIGRLDKRDKKLAYRLVGVEIDLQNIDWIIRLRQFFEMDLDMVLDTLVPGGSKVNRAIIVELYQAQNVTSVLQGLVAGAHPGLSTLLSARTPDYSSRLLLIRRILQEIMKREIKHILSGFPFTVGIILAYFELKSNELKRVRTILNVKQHGSSLDRIEGVK